MQQSALSRVMEENREILARLANYLNFTPRAVTARMVKDLARDCNVTTDEAFLALFSAALGLDTVENADHKRLEERYLRAGLRRLDPAVYAADEYVKVIGSLSGKIGTWELKTSDYAPYEPFVRNCPITSCDFREVAQLGYFEKTFRFPAVLENGIEWMTVTPNEIETMKEPIVHARGRVLTLGLGLGYYAFHASQKEEVSSVTVIERDENVISLFETHILPKFPHKEKIKILKRDALVFMEKELNATAFDSIFCDLWHDQSDGLPLYLRLKKTEDCSPAARFDYWIEPTLLSSLRQMVWENFTAGALSVKESDLPALLTDNALRDLAKKLKKVN